MSDSNLAVSACFDRHLAWCEGESVRYLVIDLEAPPSPEGTEASPGLNLALVIDASGSMSGRPLAAAKEAAAGVARSLADGDVYSLVSFDNNVVVHTRGVALDSSMRDEAEAVIGLIEPGGSTNLSGGWLEGAACVEEGARLNAGRKNRVVLLSDGHANAGITQPELLEHRAALLAQRQVYTSTVGIGDHYSPLQLQAIAEYGGGRLHDAQLPHEIVEVVMAELRDVTATVAEDVVVGVRFAPGVRVESLTPFPAVSAAGEITVRVGAFIGRAKRTVIFRVTAPAGEIGSALGFSVGVSWQVPGGTDRLSLDPLPAGLTFADGAVNSAQVRDIATSLKVVRAWQAAIVRRVAQMNMEGALEQAAAYTTQQLHYLERYCDGLPIEAAQALRELERVRRMAGQQWTPRTSKEVHLAMRRRQYEEPESRGTARPDWSTILEDERRSSRPPRGEGGEGGPQAPGAGGRA